MFPSQKNKCSTNSQKDNHPFGNLFLRMLSMKLDVKNTTTAKKREIIADLSEAVKQRMSNQAHISVKKVVRKNIVDKIEFWKL